MMVCIVKFVQDIDDALTGLTGIEWSCNVRRAHV